MNILVAPDAFKDALSAKEAATAIGKGLTRVNNEWDIVEQALSDGGEGALDLLLAQGLYERQELDVLDPLFRPIKAAYGWNAQSKEAFVELAQASGLELLAQTERNPLKTTTYGTGQLIRDAIAKGAEKVYLSIGGSATNDGGAGMASALGFCFYNERGDQLSGTGEDLLHISDINTDQVMEALGEVDFEVLCDVKNPFYGIDGAAYVYGAQKGANTHQIQMLDKGMRNFAKVLRDQLGTDIAGIPGSGAAGGTGGGAVALFDANLQSGFEVLSELIALEDMVKKADYIFTGEGKVDRQSLNGKVLGGLLELTRKHDKKVLVLCGVRSRRYQAVLDKGVQAIFTINDRSQAIEYALARTAEQLTATAEQVGRML